MIGYTTHEIEAGRPAIDAMQGVNFALQRLCEDDEHLVTQEIVRGLTFEELLGVLLVARDTIKETG